MRDRQQVDRRVVGKRDLSRESRAQARIRLEEAVHQSWVAGDDDDEPVAEVLHPLEQRLDRLRPEVEAAADRRERIGLVDEEDAVQRTADSAIGLDRGLTHVLADEPGTIDLDEMPALEETERAVHLREQACNCGLAGSRIAEEDEVLRRR